VIEVVIVSADPSNLSILGSEPDLRVCAIEPNDFEQTVTQVAAYEPNIIIIDDSNEAINVDILSHVCALRCPDAQLLVLLDSDSSPDFNMLKSAGFKVRGYINHDQRPFLAKAVRVINAGESWLPRKLVAEMLDYFLELESNLL